MGEPHKRMLILLGLGFACYGAWTLCLIVFSLIAESGGKNSNPWLALGLLWPPIELFRSWWWVLRHPDQYVISRSRRLGDGLVFGAILVSPPITILLPLSDEPSLWEFGVALPAVLTVLACWAARKLWSRAAESSSGSVLGL